MQVWVMMRRFRTWVVFGMLAGFFFLLAGPARLEATLKYKKETGKKCTFCHTAIPNQGDEDPKLNREGRRFKENGYRLTEDQKRMPD